MTQTAAEIASVESEIAAYNASLVAAQNKRSRQHAEYREQVQDQEAVMGLLHDAINIMQSFYGTPAAALLQLFQPKEEAPPAEELMNASANASANGSSAAESAPLTAPSLN